ncbi:MAG: DUF2460 domain-containing protein, partial [Hyphomicrobiales bacterium]
KTYGSGPRGHARRITKPAAGSVIVAVDGTAAAATVDSLTGIVTLAAPPAMGAVVTAGFAFDVPVRFDTDLLRINLASFRAGEVPQIPILEIRA